MLGKETNNGNERHYLLGSQNNFLEKPSLDRRVMTKNIRRTKRSVTDTHLSNETKLIMGFSL